MCPELLLLVGHRRNRKDARCWQWIRATIPNALLDLTYFPPHPQLVRRAITDECAIAEAQVFLVRLPNVCLIPLEQRPQNFKSPVEQKVGIWLHGLPIPL